MARAAQMAGSKEHICTEHSQAMSFAARGWNRPDIFAGQISTMVRRWTPLWTNWPMASSKPWMLMRC